MPARFSSLLNAAGFLGLASLAIVVSIVVVHTLGAGAGLELCENAVGGFTHC